MNAVRAAIAFPVPLVAPADVFHTAAAVPVTDHGAEHVPTFLTGQQPSITVLYTVVDRRTRLLFQPRLDFLPDCFFNDNRIDVLVAKPVRFVDWPDFAAEIFPAVIDQHAGKMVITFNYKEGTKTITFAELQEAISNKNGSDLDCLAAPLRNDLWMSGSRAGRARLDSKGLSSFKIVAADAGPRFCF